MIKLHYLLEYVEDPLSVADKRKISLQCLNIMRRNIGTVNVKMACEELLDVLNEDDIIIPYTEDTVSVIRQVQFGLIHYDYSNFDVCEIYNVVSPFLNTVGNKSLAYQESRRRIK